MYPIAAHFNVISFWWRQCSARYTHRHLFVGIPPASPTSWNLGPRLHIIIRFGVGGTLNSKSPGVNQTRASQSIINTN